MLVLQPSLLPKQSELSKGGGTGVFFALLDLKVLIIITAASDPSGFELHPRWETTQPSQGHFLRSQVRFLPIIPGQLSKRWVRRLRREEAHGFESQSNDTRSGWPWLENLAKTLQDLADLLL